MAETPELCASLEEAEAYFAARPQSVAWSRAGDDEKRRALAHAALVLDSACQFTSDALYVAADGVRKWRPRIVAALCEQALWSLLHSGGAAESFVALGVSRAEIAGIAASFRANDSTTLVCTMARRLIGRLGSFDSLDDGGGSIASTPLAL